MLGATVVAVGTLFPVVAPRPDGDSTEGMTMEYENMRFERHGDVLHVIMHTEGGALRWSSTSHREFPQAFADVASRYDVKVVVITGSGDSFCDEIDHLTFGGAVGEWDRLFTEARQLVHNLLAIDVPVVAAVNGPARVHAELALLADIVIASETAVFSDGAHFPAGAVPGDGAHILFLDLLGTNRGRYFLLTGGELSADDALQMGLVGEVVPQADVLRRADELAQRLAEKPAPLLRFTREAITADLKRRWSQMLGYGLALEATASLLPREQGSLEHGSPARTE
jgi:enoyl-CoA hydratase/carnithine racemase